MNLQALQESGLTKNESLVYLALLELGQSLAGQISRKSGLHRRTVYDTLEILLEKGLVSFILKNNRKLFQASNPKRFLDILKERESLIQQELPIMLDFYQASQEKEEASFYKGKEGLRTVFEQQLEEKEILILGASSQSSAILPFYFKWYDLTRKKKRIKARIISSDKLPKIPLAEVRHLPEKYASPLAINIYGDKVAMILWTQEPIAIVIKDKPIAEGYKKYFELVWKQARK